MKILFGMRDDGDMTEPMNVMLLSALAKKSGHQTGLWLMERDDLKDTLKSFTPEVMAFSCITGSHRYYTDAALRVKEFNPAIQTVFGGPHFTFFPGEILIKDQIDYICAGEGDESWPELLTCLEAGKVPDQVPNIISKNNSATVLIEAQKPDSEVVPGIRQSNGFDRLSISQKHLRPRLTKLDDLPFMDRGLIYNNTDFHNRYKRTLMASRGCPFRCTYCFEHQWNELYRGLGNIRQFYSVDRFLDELEYIKTNWDTRFFKFYDDVMLPFPNPAEIAWHQEFCSKYPARIGLPFHLLTRCDLVVSLRDRLGINVIADWKKAGMVSMTMSIESGNPFIRDHVIMRDMSGQEIVESFKMAYDAGVYTFPNVILGIPAPLLPYPDDSKFDKKIDRVSEEIKILQKLNGRKIDIDKAVELSRQWSLDESDYRRHLVNFLESAGLRYSYVEYEKESVRYTLAQKPSFPEFPILAPFPKTKATDWTIARGDFDGDYDKLHASYQHRSALFCFSEQEKTVQQNLALLGSFLALFAGSRNRMVKLLDHPMQYLCIGWLSEITHPWATRLYGWLYTVSKAYMHQTRIYPIKYTLGEKFRFYYQMVTLDFWKQFQKRKILRGNRPGQTLGGPASL